MFVNPFLAGVVMTLCAEIMALFIAAVIATARRMKK